MDFQKTVISNTEPDRKAKVWARPTKEGADLLILDAGKWKPVMSEEIIRKIMEDIGTATEIIEGGTPSYSDMKYGKMYFNPTSKKIFIPIADYSDTPMKYEILEISGGGLTIHANREGEDPKTEKPVPSYSEYANTVIPRRDDLIGLYPTELHEVVEEEGLTLPYMFRSRFNICIISRDYGFATPTYHIQSFTQRGCIEQKGNTENNEWTSRQWGTTPILVHESTETTVNLTPNVYHIFPVMASLTISGVYLDSGIQGLHEYMFEFQSGSTPTTLSLPSSLVYGMKGAPTIKVNTTYEFHIQQGKVAWEAYPATT